MTPPPETPELHPEWVLLREIAAGVRPDWDAAEVEKQVIGCQNSQVPFGAVFAAVTLQARIAGPLDIRHLLPRRAEVIGTGGVPRNPEYLAKKAELTTNRSNS